MSVSKQKSIELKIIAIGRALADSGLLTAGAGNLSARLDPETILITATGSELGRLKKSDIIKVDLGSNSFNNALKRPSSELPMHSLIYKNFPCRVVIHCHPPLTNGYFAVMPKLKVLTFETRFYLNDVPAVKQKSLNVTDPESVILALKTSRIVVVRNHGVFSIADTFHQALNRVLILEEAVKVAALARLFKKKALDRVDREIKKCLLLRK